MQMPTLIIAAALLAFAGGCKSKEKVPDASENVATTMEQGDPAKEVIREAAEYPAATTNMEGDSIFFSIERTACFGSCPTYKLTILQDGSATYQGRRFAAREGRYTGQVDAATMYALKAAADSLDFYKLEDKYDQPVTDLPSVIIRVHADERDKQVIGRVGSPEEFKALTKRAEALLADVEWTKIGDLR